MKRLLLALVAALLLPAAASATPLWNAALSTTPWTELRASPHDFTGSNPQASYQDLAQNLCQSCHAPHNPISASFGPLWNHAVNSGASFYTMYGTTIAGNDPAAAQPGNASLRCLGCHDGSTNVDAFGGSANGSTGSFTILTKFNNNSNVGQDLTDDHPVGYTKPSTSDYHASQSVAALYNNRVECASCHDPHGTTYGVKFLRAADFCDDCHNK